MQSSLSRFHPLIQQWFVDTYGQPTDIQDRSWPLIADHQNVLISAPTGSGKTLTAFLWAINQLVTGQWPSEQTSVLYISPLKALNNDIRRNLNFPLEEIRKTFEQAGEQMPLVRVFTRSGDTPQADRRKMLRHPPEILITTPESLNLLLSSKSGREILTSLSTVILDEIHAVVGDKRGVHLITAVDRLVKLSGEFQRISLSATIKPMEPVAQFIGGYQLSGTPKSPEYNAREVSIVESDIVKNYQIDVRFPDKEISKDIDDPVWTSFAEEFKEIVQNNRSTLLFANSRKLSEKLTYKINATANQVLAYAHHGSLSKEIREEVEQKLKNGELKAIVATSSLEMGIDIGDLDEVVLIQSPPSVSSAVQRIGRAGHRVGETSKGTIFPSHAQDFISAAVLAEAIDRKDIEPTNLVQAPLDVLCQIIISMVGVETWDIDELYAWLRTSFPFHHLSFQQYDLVLNMLAGRYAESKIRELKPRISIDRLDNTVEGKKGSLMSVYMSGGTIPDRGYFQLRHMETGARIGELDEEYVWEARIGQIATIGTQNWRIQKITHNDVFATPVGSPIMNTPFWKSEEYGRDFHFSKRILDFLESAEDRLHDPEFRAELGTRFHMNPASIRELVDFLEKQKEETESKLPHRHHLLLEYVSSGPDGAPGSQLAIHTLWGGKLNRPFAMALDAAWEETFGDRLEIFPGNDCIVLQLAQPLTPEKILSLVKSDTVESLLRKRLEGSGFFGARFRECAGRALLITRNKINQRMPLWMSRLRSQKLLESILKYDDFPILLETWRTCLVDEFDLPGLKEVLGEIESGAIKWSVAYTNRPSPFAAGLTWNQIDKYMYQTDQPASTQSSLRPNLLQEVVFNPELRPAIPESIIQQFENKKQRLAEGYAPQTARELVDWVKERVLIPHAEWKNLIKAINSDTQVADEILNDVSPKLVKLENRSIAKPIIASLEYLPEIIAGLYKNDPSISATHLDGTPVQIEEAGSNEIETSSHILFEWFQFYGPKTSEFINETLGLRSETIEEFIKDAIQSQQLISGNLVADQEQITICDSENFEILLRLNRADARPVFQALELESLPLFLAKIQGLTRTGSNLDSLHERFEQLVCLPLPAELWESEVLPARMQSYQISYLDSVMQEGELGWIGSERQKIAFCYHSDWDMIQAGAASEIEDDDKTNISEDLLETALKDREGRYTFSTLQQLVDKNPSDLNEEIWKSVWKSKLTNDSFASVRKGIEHKFQFQIKILDNQTQTRRGRRTGGRTGFAKWRGSLPTAGNWFLVPKTEAQTDLIEQEELNKDRVRLLLDRYGILFRELLHKEAPEFNWRSIFRSLRLMELSGEILAGYFFENIPGPQFISHQAFRSIQAELPESAIYWLNATDPASLCGVTIDGLKAMLPKRLATSHLVFKGTQLVLISERQGKNLTINADPDDEYLQEYFAPLKHLLYRQFMPIKQIVVETINGEDANKSPYVDALKTSFEVLTEFKKITLYRKL